MLQFVHKLTFYTPDTSHPMHLLQTIGIPLIIVQFCKSGISDFRGESIRGRKPWLVHKHGTMNLPSSEC